MSNPTPRQQLTILEAMVLIAGVAYGLWLFPEAIPRGAPTLDLEAWVMVAIVMLGGVSLAGAPMLLIDRIRYGRRWRSGALLWFGVSLACWGLAPAITLIRLEVGKGSSMAPSMAPSCFIYSLPLMGLFLLAASFIGGRPIRRWWTCRGWWPEWFGMWVLVGWAATGVYIMYLIYKDLF